MKNTIFLTLFIYTTIIIGQTNFTNGFYNGYRNGSCYNKGINCIPTIPPIAPLPRINESSDSYTDGYNRGFDLGSNSDKKDETSRERYQTTSSNFVENKMSNINYNDAIAIANVLKQAKGKALELLNDGAYEESLEICKTGLGISPQDDEFMMLIGEIYYKYLNDNQSAIYYLEQAYNINKMDTIRKKINQIKSKNNQKEMSETDRQKVKKVHDEIDEQVRLRMERIANDKK